MLKTNASRSAIGVVMITVLAFTQACRSYQRPSGSPAPGTRARVESTTPFRISTSVSSGDSACEAMSANGVVETATSEAITFSEIKGIKAAAWVGPACSGLSAGTITLRPGDEVGVRRFSITRTAILLASIAGLVALSIGQASVGYR